MTASILEAVRSGESETLSLLPTIPTLRKWEAENADLAFHYVKPAAGDHRVRVYVRKADAA